MSGLSGVYETKKKNGAPLYRASITYRGKHISLGSYPSEEAAHHAYLEAGALLADSALTPDDYVTSGPLPIDSMQVLDNISNKSKLNIDYIQVSNGNQSHHALPFEKWIVLLNFRDNGIYIATPIYIRPRFFYYYFAPTDFFVFDRDDLFYYASHKIMRRGGHYFVADYGMQVNILSRYGIKSYAVAGKDYRFRNGNNKDFRYENIEILSAYRGVKVQTKGGHVRYKAVIHIKGNCTIGLYDTETEAAIAYNKAIDILHRAGLKKAYTPNYLEGISASAYAEIYTSLPISSYIEQYSPVDPSHN